MFYTVYKKKGSTQKTGRQPKAHTNAQITILSSQNAEPPGTLKR